MFVSVTDGLFVMARNQWVPASGEPKPSFAGPFEVWGDPKVANMLMAKPRKFLFECPHAQYSGGVGHDRVEFFWDGERNLSDPKSIELGALYDQCINRRMHCRCGQTVTGGEIFQARLDPPVHAQHEYNDGIVGVRTMEAINAKLMALDARTELMDNRLAQLDALIREMRGMIDPPILGRTLGESVRDLEKIANQMKQTKGDQAMTTDAPGDSKVKKIGRTIKADAAEAMWRVGASQATRTARDAVVAGVLKSIPKTQKELRKQLTAFFQTPYGDAVVGILLSGSISMLGAPEGSKRERLARELRVGAMTGAANEALNGILDPLRAFLMGGLDEILSGMPETEATGTGVRVDATEDNRETPEEVAAAEARASMSASR